MQLMYRECLSSMLNARQLLVGAEAAFRPNQGWYKAHFLQVRPVRSVGVKGCDLAGFLS